MSHEPEVPPVGAALVHPAVQSDVSSAATARHLLSFPEPPARESAGPIRRFFKRVFLRVLRPYAAYERRVDESLLEAIDELHTRIAEVAELSSRPDDQQAAMLARCWQRLREGDAAVAQVRTSLERLSRDAEASIQQHDHELEALRTAHDGELDERFEALKRTVDDLAGELEGRDPRKELAAMREDLEQQLNALRGVNSSRSEEFETVRAGIGREMKLVSGKVEQIAGALQNSVKATQLDAMRQELDKSMDALRQTVGRVAIDAEALRDSQQQQISILRETSSRHAADAEVRIGSHQQQLSELREAVDRISTETDRALRSQSAALASHDELLQSVRATLASFQEAQDIAGEQETVTRLAPDQADRSRRRK